MPPRRGLGIIKNILIRGGLRPWLLHVASAGSLPAWIIAKLLVEFLQAQPTLPRDAAKLLEILDECHQRLGPRVTDPLREILSGIKGGKAKQTAQSLLARQESQAVERTAALTHSFQARLDRSERNGLQRATSDLG